MPDYIFKDKKYIETNRQLIIVFTEIEQDSDFIKSKINSDDSLGFRSFYNTFYFTDNDKYYFGPLDSEDIRNDYEDKAAFVIGEVVDSYIKLKKSVFRIDTNIYMDKNLLFNSRDKNYFYKYPNISLIKILSNYTKEDIYIDKKTVDEKGHFDSKIFELFKKSLPSSIEIQNYKYFEVDKVLHDYFNDSKDYESIINKIREKRISFDYNEFLNEQIANFEDAGKVDLEKYKFILENLKLMLNKKIIETKWQKALLPYIRLLFPQYIYIIDEVKILDLEFDNRRIDYLLIDYSGNVDIIELKVPTVDLIRKNTYRDNYIGSRELTGSVMQCEKYIFYLCANKEKNEQKIKKYLNEKYGADIDVQIIRPHATIIAGRSNEFNQKQLNDFKIIRSQYSNIADIISYDDLINRVKRLIESVE